jgi:hypothetical protein
MEKLSAGFDAKGHEITNAFLTNARLEKAFIAAQSLSVSPESLVTACTSILLSSSSLFISACV